MVGFADFWMTLLEVGDSHNDQFDLNQDQDSIDPGIADFSSAWKVREGRVIPDWTEPCPMCADSSKDGPEWSFRDNTMDAGMLPSLSQ